MQSGNDENAVLFIFQMPVQGDISGVREEDLLADLLDFEIVQRMADFTVDHQSSELCDEFLEIFHVHRFHEYFLGQPGDLSGIQQFCENLGYIGLELVFDAFEQLGVQLIQTADFLDLLHHGVEVSVQIFLDAGEQLGEKGHRCCQHQLLHVYLDEPVHFFFEEILDRVEEVLLKREIQGGRSGDLCYLRLLQL
jgi:hypothetical protein